MPRTRLIVLSKEAGIEAEVREEYHYRGVGSINESQKKPYRRTYSASADSPSSPTSCCLVARIKSLGIPPRGPRERTIETFTTATRVAHTRGVLVTESASRELHAW